MSQIHTCKSCGEEYEFLPTITGKMMPVNIRSIGSTPGNMVVINGVLHVLKADERDMFSASELRTSHFATCAYAKDYRKRHPK
jgi:hypothetical protein